MGSKATITYDWLRSTKLTPVQLIYVFIAILAFIFMATDIFKALPDIVKVLVYGGTVLIGVLLGVSFVNIRKLARDMKAIYEDKTMTAEQKINAYGNLALQVLYKLGEAWELFDKQQTTEYQTEVLQKEKADLLAKIDALEKELANNTK